MALPFRTGEIPPLISILIIVLVVVAKSTAVDARELRPSDHGLEYYYAASGKSPEMMTFFGSSSAAVASSSSSSRPSGSTLPSAVKSPSSSLDDTWRTKGGVHGNGDDHVISHLLLVASLVCGGCGVALLVASALIYFLGYRNRRTSTSPRNNDNNDDDDNSNKNSK